MSEVRTLVLCVDRDDDIGYKANVLEPAVGREACLDTATRLALADPEDSDVNAIFQGIKTYDELAARGENVFIAVIGGSQTSEIDGDRRISQELERIVRENEINECIVVTARTTLEGLLHDADLVFITAGMGGGTGTGTAPVVAQIAKEQGAIVVGMVSYPFQVEKARLMRAEEGLEALSNAADSVIVLDNNRLMNFVPNLPLGQAFSVMDQLIAETVKGISETITEPSLINIDYADVRAIMSKGGVAVMLVGESKQQNQAGRNAIEKSNN